MRNGRPVVRNDTESAVLKKNANKAEDSATLAASWQADKSFLTRHANLIGRF
jgi:hypothetical protein